MREVIVAAALLAGSSHLALADACADKFVRVLTGFQDMKPTQAHIVSQMKGQKATENDFLSVSADHYLAKPTKPKGPWILTYDGAMYQSSDQGKSWKKIRSFDKEKQKAASRKSVQAQAATVRNVVCGEEMLNGVKHETLEADTTNLKPAKFEIHTKYWVDRANGDFVTRADTTMKAANYEIVTSQTWQPAAGLTLPKPE